MLIIYFKNITIVSTKCHNYLEFQKFGGKIQNNDYLHLYSLSFVETIFFYKLFS